ncbi:MAG: phosphatidylinositol-specific phospholipase C domain-containing protein [Firmicutes bacterium]|nr:phosphatidylinositol-specific phospholipase C domain-containing protein [Bacillota bacterium]
MKKFFKILITFIIIIIVAAFAVLYVVPMFETAKKSEEAQPAWMKDIPDDTLICDINIPGTHDSASAYAMLPFFSRCQYFYIGKQLTDGFRYLDIRLGAKNGELIFYHGFCACQTGPWVWSGTLKLNDAIKEVYGFLKNDPSETVIFAVKMEQGSDTAEFQKLLHECIDKDPEYWYLSDTLPVLGQCRGKIVLMRRYNDALSLGKNSGIAIDWADQGDRAGGAPQNAVTFKQETYYLTVQDRYKYDNADKWTAFTAGLDQTSRRFDSDEMQREIGLDFLSTNGSAAYGHPYSHAKALNKKLFEIDLKDHKPYGRTHWVITDFSTSDIAKHIYEVNFR